MSQTMPLIDPRTASNVSAAALFVWPVVVTGLVAASRWRKLNARFAFIVLGYLTCLGVGALVRTFGFTFFWFHSANETPEDLLVATLMNASLSVTVIGAILSVGPVLWLGKLLGRHDT